MVGVGMAFYFYERGGGGSLDHFPPFFSSPLEHFSLILVSPPFLSVCGVGYFVLCLALIVIISSFITPSLNKVNGTCP
jgi:hypothetical protein